MATPKPKAKAKAKPSRKPSGNPVGYSVEAKRKTAPAKAPAKVAKPKSQHKGRHPVDWEGVERDYRTGQLTGIELGKRYKVSPEQISRRSRAEGWTRDLREAVLQATKHALILDGVKQAQIKAHQEQAQTSSIETVAIAAEVNKQVVLGHRRDIAELRNTSFDMLAELRSAVGSMAELREYISNTEAMQCAAIRADESIGDGEKDRRIKRLQDDYDRVRKLAHEAADLHNRIGSAKALADTLVKLQTLERKAFGLDDSANNNPNAFESVLDRVHQEIAS